MLWDAGNLVGLASGPRTVCTYNSISPKDTGYWTHVQNCPVQTYRLGDGATDGAVHFDLHHLALNDLALLLDAHADSLPERLRITGTPAMSTLIWMSRFTGTVAADVWLHL